MPPHPKEIVKRTVDGEKALHLSRRLKAAHLPFLLAGRLVGDFSTVVGVSIRAVRHGRYDGPVGRRIAAEFIGEQSVGDIL